MGDMFLRSTYDGPRIRARGRARGDRDVRGRAAGQGARRAVGGRVRRPSAGAAGDRPRRGDRGADARRRLLLPRRRYGPGAIVVRRGQRGARAHRGARRALDGAGRATARSPAPAAGAARRWCHGSRSTRRRRSSTTSAWAEPASPATTSAGSHSRYSTRSSADRRPRACSRRSARSAGLAYAVYSWSSQYTDTGQVGIYVGTREDNVAKALEVIGTELERICDDPVGEDELSRAREHVKGRLALSMESTASRMNRLGRSVLMDTPLLTLDETIERLDAVDADQLSELARALYPPTQHVGCRDRPRRGPLPRGAGAGRRRGVRRRGLIASRSPGPAGRMGRRSAGRRGRRGHGAGRAARTPRSASTLEEALAEAQPDVVVDFTVPDTVFENAMLCLERGRPRGRRHDRHDARSGRTAAAAARAVGRQLPDRARTSRSARC